MANETAATYVPLGREGTGYATILQNNILPSLQNEQRRADRLYQMEEMAKQAAAKAAAKQAAEDAKYVPEFEATKGGYFMNPIQAANEQDIQEVKKAFSNPNLSLQDRQVLAKDLDRKIKGRNEWMVFNDQQLQKTLPEVQKYYNANEADIAGYAASVKDNPMNINHPVRFQEEIKKDPSRFKWSTVGESLFKPIGKDTFEYTSASGQKVSLTKDKILKPTGKKQFNPITKKEEPIFGIDYDVAADAATRDPEVVRAITNYADLRVPQLAALPSNTNVPKETLVETATKEAMDKLFANMGGVAYKQDNETTAQKAANQARGTKFADVEEVVTPIKINYHTDYTDGTTTVTPINWGMGRSVRLKQPAVIGAGRKAFLLGGNTKQLDSLIEKGVISAKQPDGSYLLNFGFNVKEFQEPKDVLQLTEATSFRTPSGVKIRPKGAFITPKEADNMRKIGLEKNFKKNKRGFRLSPGSFQVDEDTEKLAGPIFQNFDIYIPGDAGEVPELENVNPRKKPVVVTEDIDIGF